MKERRWKMLAVLLLLLLSLGVPSVGASAVPTSRAAAARSKVKVPKGVITDVILARNPDRGDLLVVYESDGRIYATVMKERRGGRYKGRKARLVSGKERIHHRPSAIWNAARNRWTVAWDTGPAELDAAMQEHVGGETPLQPSAIRIRELKARNGKPRGPERGVDDGTLNLGPLLFLPTDAGAARESTPEAPSLLRSTTPLPPGGDLLTGVEIIDPGPDGIIGTGDDGGPVVVGQAPGGDDTLTLFRDPPAPRLTPSSGAELLLPAVSFDGGGVGTANLAVTVRDPGPDGIVGTGDDGGNIRVGVTTPGLFPGVDTRGPGYLPDPLAGDGSGVFFWHEAGRCFRDLLDADQERVGPPSPGPGQICAPGIVDPFSPSPPPGVPPVPAWTLGWDGFPPGAPATGGAGRMRPQARLYSLAADGTFVEGPLVTDSKKGPLDTFVLVDSGTGRVTVLWAEARNRKKSKLWIEVVETADAE